MDILTSTVGYAFLQTLIIMFELFGIIIILGLLLGYLRNKSIKNILSSVGFNGIIFTCPGVFIHELSHYVFAKIFRYNIREVRLFRPIKGAQDGVLGYVNFSYNERSIFQKVGLFFVGFAPIFGGTFCLLIAMKFLLHDTYTLLVNNMHASLNNINILSIDFFAFQINIFKQILISMFSFNNIYTLKFWVFIYIAICVSSHIALSDADLKGSYSGIITIFIIIFVLNLFSGINISLPLITTYNIIIVILLNTSLVFSVLHLLFTILFKKIISNF
ncbi:MAG: hypothetical protein E7208_08740 [Clostridium butyricum]|nr:hypothetical protein [Clostridium butyricum]